MFKKFEESGQDHSPKCGERYPYPSLFRPQTTELLLNGYGWVERSAGTGMVRKYFETKRRERNIDRSILELEYGKGTGRLERHGAGTVRIRISIIPKVTEP